MTLETIGSVSHNPAVSRPACLPDPNLSLRWIDGSYTTTWDTSDSLGLSEQFGGLSAARIEAVSFAGYTFFRRSDC